LTCRVNVRPLRLRSDAAAPIVIEAFASVNRPNCPRFREGWERHHVIARQCLHDRVLGPFLTALHPYGFAIDDFATNGILLPALPSIAEQTGLPLHRGPHPRYNSGVMERVDEIRRAALWIDGSDRRGRFAVGTLRALQALLVGRIVAKGSRTIDAIRLCDQPHLDLDEAVDRFLAHKKSAAPQGRTPQPQIFAALG
jgi:hypothetical protein